MNFKPPETDNEARTVKTSSSVSVRHNTQQARLALIEQASQVASKRRQRFHEQADHMQASKQQSIHRARSQLLISSPNRKMSWELPQASNHSTLSTNVSYSWSAKTNDEHVKWRAEQQKQTRSITDRQARLLASGKQVIQKWSGKRCIALAVW